MQGDELVVDALHVQEPVLVHMASDALALDGDEADVPRGGGQWDARSVVERSCTKGKTRVMCGGLSAASGSQRRRRP
jgi:hypothetical protein